MSVTRRDQAYWQRLRRDKPSGFAALAAVGSCGLVLVEVIDLVLPGSQGMHRATPLYWALLIPFAWWAINLVNYDRRVSRTLIPACIIAPLVAIACVVVDEVLAAGGSRLSWLVALASVILAFLAVFFYRRSLLMVEGPAR